MPGGAILTCVSRYMDMTENVSEQNSEPENQESRARRVGRTLQQVGINMLAVGLVALVAFLVWKVGIFHFSIFCM